MPAAPKGTQHREQVLVRLPEGMREELKTAAEANHRTMNAEIVYRLKTSLRVSLANWSDVPPVSSETRLNPEMLDWLGRIKTT